MPDPVNIAFAMNLPPQQAIDYFQSKGYAMSFRWQDTWQEAHAKAFTVAGAMKMDVLASIRTELDVALEEGRTFRQFQESLEPKLKDHGWLGRTQVLDESTGEVRDIDVTPHRLRNIYRTNMQTAYEAGRYKRQKEVTESRPWWMYSALIDAATRPEHEELHQTVLPADHPFWDENYPPNGWGCRCQVRALSSRDLERRNLTPSDPDQVQGVAETSWAYNPGKAATYDAADLDPALFPDQRGWRDWGLNDLRSIPDEMKSRAEMMSAAPSAAAAHEQIAEVFGVSEQSPLRRVTTPVEDVAVNYHNLFHMAEKRQDQRERYAGFALTTLEDPAEVWLTRFQDGKYRKQYIGVFQEGNRSVLASVIQTHDGGLLWNFMGADAAVMNKNRRGDAILYRKE